MIQAKQTHVFVTLTKQRTLFFKQNKTHVFVTLDKTLFFKNMGQAKQKHVTLYKTKNMGQANKTTLLHLKIKCNMGQVFLDTRLLLKNKEHGSSKTNTVTLKKQRTWVKQSKKHGYT